MPPWDCQWRETGLRRFNAAKDTVESAKGIAKTMLIDRLQSLIAVSFPFIKSSWFNQHFYILILNMPKTQKKHKCIPTCIRKYTVKLFKYVYCLHVNVRYLRLVHTQSVPTISTNICYLTINTCLFHYYYKWLDIFLLFI